MLTWVTDASFPAKGHITPCIPLSLHTNQPLWKCSKYELHLSQLSSPNLIKQSGFLVLVNSQSSQQDKLLWVKRHPSCKVLRIKIDGLFYLTLFYNLRIGYFFSKANLMVGIWSRVTTSKVNLKLYAHCSNQIKDKLTDKKHQCTKDWYISILNNISEFLKSTQLNNAGDEEHVSTSADCSKSTETVRVHIVVIKLNIGLVERSTKSICFFCEELKWTCQILERSWWSCRNISVTVNDRDESITLTLCLE